MISMYSAILGLRAFSAPEIESLSMSFRRMHSNPVVDDRDIPQPDIHGRQPHYHRSISRTSAVDPNHE